MTDQTIATTDEATTRLRDVAPDTSAAPVRRDDRVVTALLRTFVGVAVLGWAASFLLTAIHFWVLPIPAGVEAQGPIAVITSPWAYVGPFPLALIGAVYYIAMIAAGATLLHARVAWLERTLLPITGIGVLASAGFVYLQLGPIGAICPFCMVSAAATTTLFVLELIARRRGGVAVAASVPAARVWPITFVVTMAATIAVVWFLPQLPLPGN